MHSNPLRRGALAALCTSLLAVSPGCGTMKNVFVGVKEAFTGPETDAFRIAPAQQDLPGIATVAITSLDGRDEDTNAVAGTLGGWLLQSGRFQVVERERLGVITSERGCGAADYGCLSGALPASAIVVGTVSPTTYRENVETYRYECEREKKKTTCVSYTRKGSAHASANLRLVETATGKVLYQALVSRSAESQTTADNNSPPSIDSPSLIEQARTHMTQDFFEAISPHHVSEHLELPRARGFQELDDGNEHLKGGRLEEALKSYRLALTRAESSADIDAEERAKAHYALAIAQGLHGEFATALQNLEQAIKLDDDDDYQGMLVRVRTWQTDAERTQKQLAYAQPESSAAAGVADAQ